MTDLEFKNIADRNKETPMKLCYEVYFQEAKGEKVNHQDFDHLFSMFTMMNGGINQILNSVKKKYNYGL